MTGTTEATAGELRTIPIAHLRESVRNPRTAFDPKQLDDLRASIAQDGILEPLVVRPLVGGTFEIAAGARRYRAAKLAKLNTAPCLVREMDDAAFDLFVAVEWLQSAALSPLEEAAQLARVLGESGGVDIEEAVAALAARLGKRAPYVRGRLKLLDLVEPARKLLAAGKMPLGHALLLARLDAENQTAALKTIADGRTVYGSLTNLERWIADHVLVQLSRASWKRDDAALLPAAGSCAACPKRTGAQATLWGEGGKDDRCLDPACFAAKAAAALARRVDEVRAKTKLEPLVVARAYDPKPIAGLKVLGYDKYWLVAKGTAGARPVVTVEAPLDAPQWGTTEQPKSRDRAYDAGNARAVAQDAARRRKLAAEAKLRALRFAAVVAGVKASTIAGADWLRFIAHNVVGEMHADSLSTACKLWEVPKPKGQYGWQEKAVRKIIDATDGAAELSRIIVTLLLCSHARHNPYVPAKTDQLAIAAKLAGIDMSTVKLPTKPAKAARPTKAKAAKPRAKK